MDNSPKTRFGLTKPSLRLIPASALVLEAAAFEDGARKYGAYNWRGHEVSASIYVDAALRHLHAYHDGEEVDPTSGVLHLAHARACLAIILDAAACGTLIDDRPTPGCTAELIRARTKKDDVPVDGLVRNDGQR